MSNTHWFRHDIDAADGRRFTMLRLKGGYEAHGIYWALMKYLYKSSNCYPFATTDDKQVLAASLHIDVSKLETFIQQCIECELLQILDEKLFSEVVKTELGEQKTLRKKRTNSGRLGGLAKASKRLALAKQNVAQTDSTDRQYNTIQTDSTVISNNSSKNKSKKIQIGDPPTPENDLIPKPLQELFKSQGKDWQVKNVWLTEAECERLQKRWGTENLCKGMDSFSKWSLNTNINLKTKLAGWESFRHLRDHASALNNLLKRMEEKGELST